MCRTRVVSNGKSACLFCHHIHKQHMAFDGIVYIVISMHNNTYLCQQPAGILHPWKWTILCVTLYVCACVCSLFIASVSFRSIPTPTKNTYFKRFTDNIDKFSQIVVYDSLKWLPPLVVRIGTHSCVMSTLSFVSIFTQNHNQFGSIFCVCLSRVIIKKVEQYRLRSKGQNLCANIWLWQKKPVDWTYLLNRLSRYFRLWYFYLFSFHHMTYEQQKNYVSSEHIIKPTVKLQIRERHVFFRDILNRRWLQLLQA